MTTDPADPHPGAGRAPLVSLSYVSSATRLFEESELDELLDECRSRNARNGVTGMMLYCDGNIMQVLEGPVTEVGATFDRIARDQRHHGLIVMLREDVAARSFSSWSMGYRKLRSRADLDGYSSYLTDFSNPVGPPSSAGLAQLLLTSFRDSMR